jgi:hypothetical protein
VLPGYEKGRGWDPRLGMCGFQLADGGDARTRRVPDRPLLLFSKIYITLIRISQL